MSGEQRGSESLVTLLDDITVFCLGEANDVLRLCDRQLRRMPIVFPLALAWLYVAQKALVARCLVTSAASGDRRDVQVESENPSAAETSGPSEAGS